jgi:hypothetical protein
MNDAGVLFDVGAVNVNGISPYVLDGTEKLERTNVYEKD